jgi:hypothetical protein
MPAARRRFTGTIERGVLQLASSSYDALTGADALVVATDWNEYRHPNFARIRAALARPVVVDGRNLWDPSKLAALGFAYHSIGRAVARAPELAIALPGTAAPGVALPADVSVRAPTTHEPTPAGATTRRRPPGGPLPTFGA